MIRGEVCHIQYGLLVITQSVCGQVMEPVEAKLRVIQLVEGESLAQLIRGVPLQQDQFFDLNLTCMLGQSGNAGYRAYGALSGKRAAMAIPPEYAVKITNPS